MLSDNNLHRFALTSGRRHAGMYSNNNMTYSIDTSSCSAVKLNTSSCSAFQVNMSLCSAVQVNTSSCSILNRNELWSSQSSGRPKSMLFLMQFLTKMSCGASRAPRSLQSSARPKSMLFLIQFLIEMSFGAPRALDVPNRYFSYCNA